MPERVVWYWNQILLRAQIGSTPEPSFPMERRALLSGPLLCLFQTLVRQRTSNSFFVLVKFPALNL